MQKVKKSVHTLFLYPKLAEKSETRFSRFRFLLGMGDKQKGFGADQDARFKKKLVNRKSTKVGAWPRRFSRGYKMVWRKVRDQVLVRVDAFLESKMTKNEKVETPTFGGFRVFSEKSEKKMTKGGRWRYKRENRFQQKSGKSLFRFFTQNAFFTFRGVISSLWSCWAKSLRYEKLETRFVSEVGAWPRRFSLTNKNWSTKSRGRVSESARHAP